MFFFHLHTEDTNSYENFFVVVFKRKESTVKSYTHKEHAETGMYSNNTNIEHLAKLSSIFHIMKLKVQS